MLAEEYLGFANFVIGRVHKLGREVVLQESKTAFKCSENYWLKESYFKLLHHAEEIKLKSITQKIGSDPTNPLEIKVTFDGSQNPLRPAQ